MEALDERAVPDGTPGDPPAGPPGQTGEPGAPTAVTLADGNWLSIDSVGDTDVYYTRSEGAGYLVTVDSVTGDFSVTPTEYTTPVVPGAADGVQANFAPDAALPSAVWNPNTGTYSTVPAGTVFAGAVGGYVADGWNFVVLPLAAGFDPTAERLIPAGAGNVSLSPADPATPPGSIKVKIIGPNGQQIGPTVQMDPSGTVTPPPGATLQIAPNGDLTIILPGQQPPTRRALPPPPERAPMPRRVGPPTGGALSPQVLRSLGLGSPVPGIFGDD